MEGGVSRIVDQIVEQKMDYIQSKVEEILYQYVGIEKQQSVKKENGALEIDTDLIPTDLELEQVSPDSDKKSLQGNEEIEEEVVDDFESPAFEPIEPVAPEKPEENQNSNLSEISGLTSQDSPMEKAQSEEKEDETMLSQISSNEKSSTFVNPDNNEMTGEEAQMAPESNDESTAIKEPEPMIIESPKFDLHKDSIEFTGTERKNILSDESTSSNDDKVSAPPPAAPTHHIEPQTKADQMEIDNIENDTTDSSEARMEIDLKDESTQESSKVGDFSQDSSQKIREKEKDSHSHRKHSRSDRSKDRYKRSSSSHKSGLSSSHRHHSKSTGSRHESSADKHKSRSGKSSSSSSSHKKSSANTSDKEKDKDKDKDRTSSSSSSHKKSKYRDEHHSSSSSKSRRKSAEHESVSDEKAKADNEKVENEMTAAVEKSDKSESSAAELKKKSSILMKYDYLKAESTNEKQRDDDDDCSDFLGFAREQCEPQKSIENPWIQLLQKESEWNRKKNLDKKILSTTDGTSTHTNAKTKVTRKSKSPGDCSTGIYLN